MRNFQGTGVALVTPFNDDFSVDYSALEKLIEFNISNGVEYLVVFGTTGESVTLNKQEKKEVLKFVIKLVADRVPIVIGIGSNNTLEVVEEIKNTDFTGVSGILSVSPYYSKPTQEGIYAHFKAIAEATELPIILYNVPGRTSSNMLPETIVKLYNDFSNIVGVKEAGNNVAQYLRLLKIRPEGLLVISGDDDLALGIVLAGGDGVISVIGQGYPKEFSEMIRLGLQGNAKESYKYHYALLDVTEYIFAENNPAGIKCVLKTRGIGNGKVRLPLVPATESLEEKIKEFVAQFDKNNLLIQA